MARRSASQSASSSRACYTSRPSSRTCASSSRSRPSSRTCASSSRSRPSSRTCYTSTHDYKSKHNSTVQCVSVSKINKYLRDTVKIMYNDVRLHLSQFIIRCLEDRDFDMPDHRKKASDHQDKVIVKSKPNLSYNVHDHQDKVVKSKTNLSNNVHDHQDKVVVKSMPSFSYRCYPFSHINKGHCEDGNKIIMPASAIDVITSMRGTTEYPLTFKIINPLLDKFSHCGILEYSGEEKRSVYLPNWMMNSLLLQQGQIVNIECAALSKATFLKIQPCSTEFIMNLSDKEKAMERILKDFACVTTGDTIMVNHEKQSYYLNIVQARPENAVSLIETDCELEFMKSLDHKGPEETDKKVEEVKDATRVEENDKKLVVCLRKYSRRAVQQRTSTSKTSMRR
ncbi:hypothetical protein POM88_015816 [Heracleum sosnowskyi]|uniref:Ubiquitin fusion degradaton protein n=1 Tax=Heracleum sosnowskyi TaxID=360622 RepID=A0AAD8IM36_9APIA|nr:hypothetical protein POM88_015816 [Heracleum sosnowskyi]